MAIAQNTFDKLRNIAYEGQIADINVARIDSYVNNSSAVMKPGRFVVADGPNEGAALPNASSVAADFLGVTPRTPASENLNDQVFGVKEKDIASVMKTGRIFVKCQGGCNRGGTVFVEIKGSLEAGSVSGATSADNVELNGVHFAATAADGELVEIVLDGNLAILIPTSETE